LSRNRSGNNQAKRVVRAGEAILTAGEKRSLNIIQINVKLRQTTHDKLQKPKQNHDYCILKLEDRVIQVIRQAGNADQADKRHKKKEKSRKNENRCHGQVL